MEDYDAALYRIMQTATAATSPLHALRTYRLNHRQAICAKHYVVINSSLHILLAYNCMGIRWVSQSFKK